MAQEIAFKRNQCQGAVQKRRPSSRGWAKLEMWHQGRKKATKGMQRTSYLLEETFYGRFLKFLLLEKKSVLVIVKIHWVATNSNWVSSSFDASQNRLRRESKLVEIAVTWIEDVCRKIRMNWWITFHSCITPTFHHGCCDLDSLIIAWLNHRTFLLFHLIPY